MEHSLCADEAPVRFASAPRNLRFMIAGATLSSMGSAMVPVALTFALLERGFGASGVGVVLGAETATLLVLLMLGGTLADGHPRRPIMLAADLMRMVSEAILAALLAMGNPALWEVAALAAVLGAGQAFHVPARSGLLAEIAPPDRLHRANALFGMARAAGDIGGPALAGILVAMGSACLAITADAASFALSAACVASLRLPPRSVCAKSGLFALLRDGWREFTSRDWLWVIVGQFGALCVTSWAPFMVLGAVMVGQHGGGPKAWGLILAFQGAGSFAGGLLAMRMTPRSPLVVCEMAVFLTALPFAFLAGGEPIAIVAAGSALSGLGMAVCNTMWNTTMQREVPTEALARVKAYDMLGSMSLMPLGYALAEPSANLFGAEGALWIGAAAIVLSTAVILCMRSVRMMRWT